MSVSKASTDRYRDPTFVAAYLEAEWGDKLAAHGVELNSLPGLNPACFSKFYERVALFAKCQIGNQIGTVCDIGCSTGRFLYEFCQRFSGMTDVVGVEPSPVFTDYAKKFLLHLGVKKTNRIPIPKTQVRPGYVKLEKRFFESVAINSDQGQFVEIITERGEKTPRSAGYFDALFCLNVVDRHGNPKTLVAKLSRLVKKEGSFFLASPMDWDKRFTKREYWVDDLADLFSKSEWERHAETNVSYPFRYALRHQTNYISQVVCMRKK